MDLVLGIDLGTSFLKLGLFDPAGELRGLGRVAVEPDRGDGTRCEWPADRFWRTLRAGLAEALADAGARPTDVRGLSYASQANSFLLLDGHDRPLTPLILWPDARADDEADPAVRRLAARDDFLATTGLGLFGPAFVPAKLGWFRRHRPELWARVRRIQTISDHLVSGLTGRPAGDAGTASLLGLWNLRDSCWWREALDEFAINPAHLSGPLPPGTPAGRLAERSADLVGLPAGIPLAVGGLDHYVAAVGAGIGTLAPVSESTGTVIAAVRCLDDFRPLADCAVGPTGLDKPPYYRLAFDSRGAGTLQWYQRNFAPRLDLPALLAQAGEAPIGCDGLIARPAPEQSPGSTGFLNATGDHTAGHFARAILESTSAGLAGLIDRLCPDGRPDRMVATGGAARSDLWLQIKADLTGATLIAAACPEPGCLGAAMIAAASAGWFDDYRQAAVAWVSTGRAVEPTDAGRDQYARWLERYRRAIAR